MGYWLRAHEGDARGIIVLVKCNKLVKKYRDKTTLASKTLFTRHCFGFQSRLFPLLLGYNIQPSSSLTNPNAALIIDNWLHFTNISETIYPEMLIFGTRASWTLFFQNILTNPIISKIQNLIVTPSKLPLHWHPFISRGLRYAGLIISFHAIFFCPW